MIKHIANLFLLGLLMGIIFISSCKTSEKNISKLTDTIKIQNNPVAQVDTDYYMTVHQMPEFQGGDINVFVKHLKKQIKYPAYAIKKNLQGLVVIQFGVDCYGKVQVFDVLKSSGSKTLDNEAKRVLSASPVWKPAIFDNIPVGKLYVLQFKFSAATRKIEIF